MHHQFRQLMISLFVGISTLISTVISINMAFAIEPVEVAKLLASDGFDYDAFGESVAVDSDTIVIGAHGDDDLGSRSGSAYVFVRDGTNWTEQAKLTASDGVTDDFFGRSVAVDGDTVVVGANGDDDQGSRSGSAYVFVRDGTNWTEQAKLTASDGAADDWFGYSVAVDGDTVVIGAYGDDAISGSAYVFVRDGTLWVEQAKLTASDGVFPDAFGRSVAVAGDTIFIGAYGTNAKSGSVYVFVRDSTSWIEQTKLMASDGVADDYFGISVASDGDTVVIGALGASGADFRSGSAYVFVRDSTSWIEQTKLTASDGVVYDHFGESVAVDDDTVVIGAYSTNDLGSSSGSAYVFVRDGTSWIEQTKLMASDGVADDYFGRSVAVDGNIVVIGANGDDDQGSYSGSTYVYLLPSTPDYSCVGFEPPMADYPVSFKKNHSLPLRAKIFNTDGVALTGPDLAAPPVVQVWFDSGQGDDAIDVSDDVLAAGQGDEGNQFVFTEAGKWEFILGTKNYTASGTYTVLMQTGDQSEYVFSPTCVTEFVVQ